MRWNGRSIAQPVFARPCKNVSCEATASIRSGRLSLAAMSRINASACVGVPANNFGSQEPGTEPEIKQFCSSKYGVKFDMLSKVSVKGNDICPLYKFLTSKETDPQFGGDIKWNFEKFLIAKDGNVVGHFLSKTKPDDAEFVKTIESELAK